MPGSRARRIPRSSSNGCYPSPAKTRLTIDRKYREPWTGRLPTRFLILTNELPRLSDASGALASRFILLVLTQSFYGKENPKLTGELLAEASGIFNWALEGLDRLTQRGYFVNPESGADAIRQMEDLSSPVSAFLRDQCVIGGANEVKVEALWTAWKTWCTGENRHPGTKELFGRDLRAAVPTLKKRRPRTDDGERDHLYQGLGLVDTTFPNHGDHYDQPPAGHSGHSGPAMYSPQDSEGVCCQGGALRLRVQALQTIPDLLAASRT